MRTRADFPVYVYKKERYNRFTFYCMEVLLMELKKLYHLTQATAGEPLLIYDLDDRALSPSDTLDHLKRINEEKGLKTLWGDENQLIVHISGDCEVHYHPLDRGVQQIEYLRKENECEHCGYIGKDVTVYGNDEYEVALCDGCYQESDMQEPVQ